MASIRDFFRQLSGQGSSSKSAEPADGGEAPGVSSSDTGKGSASLEDQDYSLEQVLAQHSEMILKILYPDFDMWAPYFQHMPAVLVRNADARYAKSYNYAHGYRMDPDEELYRETLVSLFQRVVATSTPDWVSACIVDAVREASREDPRVWGEFSMRINDQVGDEFGVYKDSPVARRLVRIARENYTLRGILTGEFGKELFL